MEHYNGEVRGLDGYRRLIQWLNTPRSDLTHTVPGTTLTLRHISRFCEGPVKFYDSLDNVGDAQITQQITQELVEAFQSNDWLTRLSIQGEPASNLVPVLKLLHELKVTEYLQLSGHVPWTTPGISNFLLGPARPPSLKRLGFNYCFFDSDLLATWDAIDSEMNEWLEAAEFCGCRFDEANTDAFVKCFKKWKKTLDMHNCHFHGTTHGAVAADIFVNSRLKSLEFDPFVVGPGVAQRANTESMMKKLEEQVDATDESPLPELDLRLSFYPMESITRVRNSLPNLTKLRKLQVHAPGLTNEVEGFMEAMKQNGSLHSADFSFGDRPTATRDKKLGDAYCLRNKHVPELLHDAHQQDTVPGNVPALILAAIQSPRMACTTLLAASELWDRLDPWDDYQST